MRNLILLAAATIPAVSIAAPSDGAAPGNKAVAAKVCANTKMLWAERTDGGARLRKLGELPAGDLALSVVREVDGCVEPAIIGYDYGAVAPRDNKKAPRPRRQ